MNTFIVIIIFALIIALLCILYFTIVKVENDTKHMNINIHAIECKFQRLEELLTDHSNANIIALDHIKDTIETADANNVEEVNDTTSTIKDVTKKVNTLIGTNQEILDVLKLIDSKLANTCKGDCGTIHHCRKERTTEPKKKTSLKPKSNKSIKTEEQGYVSVSADTKQ